MSVGLSGDILTVVNKAMDPGHPGQSLPDYATFRVNPHGKLTLVPHSTFFVDQNASPTQALPPSPRGDLIFGRGLLRGACSARSNSNGTAALAGRGPCRCPPPSFPDPTTPRFPLGLAVHPTRPLLYVGYVTINRIGVYHYNRVGELNFLRTVPDSGNAPAG